MTLRHCASAYLQFNVLKMSRFVSRDFAVGEQVLPHGHVLFATLTSLAWMHIIT